MRLPAQVLKSEGPAPPSGRLGTIIEHRGHILSRQFPDSAIRNGSVIVRERLPNCA